MALDADAAGQGWAVSARVGIPPGWQRTGETVMTRDDFRIAWCWVGEGLRFVITRAGSERVAYRDDIPAAVAVADEWDNGSGQ